jgi:hypothetical protein
MEPTPSGVVVIRSITKDGWMVTRKGGRIFETATEERQALPGPSTLLVLSVSIALTAIVLGVVWFIFLRV